MRVEIRTVVDLGSEHIEGEQAADLEYLCRAIAEVAEWHGEVKVVRAFRRPSGTGSQLLRVTRSAVGSGVEWGGR